MSPCPFAAASLSATAAPDNGAADVPPHLVRLELADTVIWWIGLAVIVITVGVWLVRSRRDPLANAPLRSNRLLPEHVLAFLVGFVALSMMVGFAADLMSDGRSYRMSGGNLAQLIGGVVCLAMAAKLFDGGVRGFVLGRGSVARHTVRGVLLLVAAFTACGLVYEGTVRAFSLLRPDYELPNHSVIEALRNSTEPAWWLRLGAVGVAPLAEEFFFRGLMQTALRNIMRRPWPPVLICAVLFGVAHSQQPQVVPTLVLLGVLLGAAYERTGSLVTPIVLHSLFNLKTIIWEALGAPA